MAERVEVLLGLGSNLGEPAAQLANALRLLQALVQVEAISSVYRTEPVGFADQPDFLNLACAGRTELSLDELLGGVHAIERSLGRERTFLNSPRLIDIDVLAYGEHILETTFASVPHPRLHERAFVLAPLAEIRPDWIHPRLGRSAATLLGELQDPERVERIGPLV